MLSEIEMPPLGRSSGPEISTALGAQRLEA
jgi:hypothetical protein